jgi:hypothetical protein
MIPFNIVYYTFLPLGHRQVHQNTLKNVDNNCNSDGSRIAYSYSFTFNQICVKFNCLFLVQDPATTGLGQTLSLNLSYNSRPSADSQNSVQKCVRLFVPPSTGGKPITTGGQAHSVCEIETAGICYVSSANPQSVSL